MGEFNHLSIDWLSHWLVGWLIDWLIDWLVCWFIDWLIDWLIGWLVDRIELNDRMKYWLVDWVTHWLIGLFDQIVRGDRGVDCKEPGEGQAWDGTSSRNR